MELSAEEKKRLLRERRQAKMGKGKASERLNNILNQGSSVKTSEVTSVLDKPQPTAAPETPPVKPQAQFSSPVRSTTPDILAGHEEDPGIVDISTFDQKTGSSDDIDQIFSKLMGGGAGGEPDMSKMFAAMMSGEGGQVGDDPTQFGAMPGVSREEMEYQSKLAAYQAYQGQRWKFTFLVVRWLVVLANFGYHFVHFRDQGFQASQDPVIRGYNVKGETGSFIQVFLAAEAAILSSYFVISRQYGFKSDGGLLMKAVSMGSMVLPQLARYQPLLEHAVVYYELFGILFGDLSLVIVLFGLLSCLS
ncbi:golgi to ER traffic protein 2 [Diutina catenulata]